MRQRENALSVGMKSALRNPRTPGTAGRASGLKWSDNLEVRPRSDLAESRMPNAGEPNVSRRMSLGISPPPVPFPTQPPRPRRPKTRRNLAGKQKGFRTVYKQETKSTHHE